MSAPNAKETAEKVADTTEDKTVAPDEKKKPKPRRSAADLLSGMDVAPTPPSSSGSPDVDQDDIPNDPPPPTPAPPKQELPPAVSKPSCNTVVSGLSVQLVVRHVPERLVWVEWGEGRDRVAAVDGQQVETTYSSPGDKVISLVDAAEATATSTIVVTVAEPQHVEIVQPGPALPAPASMVQARRPQARTSTIGVRVTPEVLDYYQQWCRLVAAEFSIAEKHVTAHVADTLIDMLPTVRERIQDWLDVEG